MLGNLPNFFTSPHSIAATGDSEPVLVALSGGADSSALLHILCRYRETRPFRLCAAHVNHNIRTEEYNNEAMRDQQFCAELCRALNVELFIADVDIPALAQISGNSLETEARIARYSFFAEVMKANGIKILATAHNADDNLETQIFNLCRGCGIEGICGIPQARSFDSVPDGVIVRPILGASKSEILDFCRTNKIDYVTDSTNSEDDYTRNAIRLRVIPELRKLFTSPERSAARLSKSAAEDNNLLLAEAKEYLETHSEPLVRSELEKMHPAMSKRILMLAFKKHTRASIEAFHLEEIIKFIASGKTGALSLPGRIRVVISNSKVAFEDEAAAKVVTEPYNIPLFEGDNATPCGRFTVRLSKAMESVDETPKSAEYASAFISNVSISSLRMTTRQSGDKIYDGGVGKKLKKLMCDRKIESSIRDLLPIIRLGDEIVYVPRCAVADKYRANKHNSEYKITVYINNVDLEEPI